MFGDVFISYRFVAIYVVYKLSAVREPIQESRNWIVLIFFIF